MVDDGTGIMSEDFDTIGKLLDSGSAMFDRECCQARDPSPLSWTLSKRSKVSRLLDSEEKLSTACALSPEFA